MSPKPDRSAEQFDEALERLRAGEVSGSNDDEFGELLNLARRLDEELAEDLPDPAFRAQLRERLVHQSPVPAYIGDTGPATWQRTLTSSSWRVGAVAAAFSIFLIAVIAVAVNPFGGNGTDDTSDPDQPVTFQTADDTTEATDPVATDDVAWQTDDPDADATRWASTALPPLDIQHVVFSPLLATAAAPEEVDESEPEIEMEPDLSMPEMPSSASIFYLSAPPEPQNLLLNIQQRLDIEGEIVSDADSDLERVRLINENDEEVMYWDPASAFLMFNAGPAGFEREQLGTDSEDPVEIARAFLETIGFDLYSIEYQPLLQEDDTGNVQVLFRPESIPETALDVSLGAVVVFDQQVNLQEAWMIWLSLTGEREVDLRDAEEAWESGLNGEGFWSPHDLQAFEGPVMMTGAAMVYLLTRVDQSSFIMQPAVKFWGTAREDDGDDDSPVARFYIPVVDKES